MFIFWVKGSANRWFLENGWFFDILTFFSIFLGGSRRISGGGKRRSHMGLQITHVWNEENLKNDDFLWKKTYGKSEENTFMNFVSNYLSYEIIVFSMIKWWSTYCFYGYFRKTHTSPNLLMLYLVIFVLPNDPKTKPWWLVFFTNKKSENILFTNTVIFLFRGNRNYRSFGYILKHKI